MTTSDLASGRPAATGRPLRGLRVLLATVVLGFAFPALAQEAMPAGMGLENISLAAKAAAAAQQANGDGATATANLPATKTTPDGSVQTLLKRALALLGTPYRWGGTGTNGFDCSGLVGYVFKTALGIDLPRVSRDMTTAGERVDRSALTAGDIVLFKVHGKRVDHVGIYVGNGQFLHAPRTGKDVMVSRLDEGYWSGKFMEARRIAGL